MNAPASPLVPFAEWLNQALEGEPTANAMSLATATSRGETALRTVLLKAYGDDGFVFFTSPDTLKVRHIAENPRVSLLFFWPRFNRQIRIDGTASRILATVLARRLFSTRVRHGAITWVSPLGRVADAREALAIRMKEVQHLFATRAANVGPEQDGGPASCHGFLVSPTMIRFWQGGAERRHVSLIYERAGADWTHRWCGS